MKIRSAGISDKGKVRANNEDSHLLDPALGLFMVADGMGGHKAGEVASQMAIETIARFIRDNYPKVSERPGFFKKTFSSVQSHTDVLVREAIESANQEIYELSMRDEEKRGMGTTLVLVLLTPEGYTIAHVGDSRIYLISPDVIKQITKDHSLVREQIERGILTPEEARKSNLKNVITRSIGHKDTVEPDIAYHRFREGDYLLLCSDGLTDLVEDEEIKEITIDESIILEDRARKLVDLANERGGKDNITIVILHLPVPNNGENRDFFMVKPIAKLMNSWHERKKKPS